MNANPLDDRPALSVVMPAYNEEAVIGQVVPAWLEELTRLGISHEMRVYDDGSKDRTGEILEDVARHYPALVAVRQANCGHGATIVRGYREARGEWVFQVDGDGELEPAAFAHLWQRREGFDFLLGWRQDRQAVLGRRVVTAVSRLTVHVLFGSGIHDVNSPFRLMRRSVLERFLPQLDGAFAPNVILSGLVSRAKLRIFEAPVPYSPRKAGAVSIGGWKLWRAAIRSFRETVAAATGSQPGRRR